MRIQTSLQKTQIWCHKALQHTVKTQHSQPGVNSWVCYLKQCFWPICVCLYILSVEFLVTKSKIGNRTQDKTLLYTPVSYYMRPHVSHHVTFHTGHSVTPWHPESWGLLKVSAEDFAVLGRIEMCLKDKVWSLLNNCSSTEIKHHCIKYIVIEDKKTEYLSGFCSYSENKNVFKNSENVFKKSH